MLLSIGIDIILVICILTAAFLFFDLGLIEFERLTPKVVVIACVIVLCVFNVALEEMYGPEVLRRWHIITVVLPFLLLGAAFHRTELARSIFSFVLVFMVVNLIFAVSDLLMAVLPPVATPVALVVGVVLAVVICFVSHKYFQGPFRELQGNTPIGWGLSSALACLGAIPLIILNHFFGRLELSVFAPFELAIVLYDLALIAVTILLTKQMGISTRSARDSDMLRIMQESQQRVDELQKQNEAAERRRRHDLRHAIQVIIDEVESGDTDAAVEHLVELRGDNMVKTTVDYCENVAVNSVIKLWATRAGESSIDMKVRADVPEGLKIDDMELATLFANLLENAYEGCMRLERNEFKRYIDLKVTYKGGKLIFAMENSCRHDVQVVEGMPISQKRGGGIGTHSAKTTVEQHGGMIRYEAEDGVFSTRFVIAV